MDGKGREGRGVGKAATEDSTWIFISGSPPRRVRTCSCAAAVDARTLRTLCARCDAILTTEKRMRPTESVMTAQATASRERMKRRITRHMDASDRPTAHTSSLHSRSNLHTHTRARTSGRGGPLCYTACDLPYCPS